MPRVRLWGREEGQPCGHAGASSGQRHKQQLRAAAREENGPETARRRRPAAGPPVRPERAAWGCPPGPAGRGRPCGGQSVGGAGGVRLLVPREPGRRAVQGSREPGRSWRKGSQSDAEGVSGSEACDRHRGRPGRWVWKPPGGPGEGVNAPQPAGLQRRPSTRPRGARRKMVNSRTNGTREPKP